MDGQNPPPLGGLPVDRTINVSAYLPDEHISG
jgi:hypothetical protein